MRNLKRREVRREVYGRSENETSRLQSLYSSALKPAFVVCEVIFEYMQKRLTILRDVLQLYIFPKI